MENRNTPAVTSRYDILDALRGFALLGICFANIPFFAGWIFVGSDAKQEILGAAFYDAFILFLVDGRFYTIFSFLFGLGFSLQLSRLQSKSNANPSYLYLRRLAILLCIGSIHLFVFWAGDILLLYATLGFVLFFLRNTTDNRLLIIAANLLLLPVAGYWLFWVFGVEPSIGLYDLAGQLVGGEPNIGVFLNGFYESVVTPNMHRYFELNPALGVGRIGYLFDTWRIPKVLAVMLIGMWAGRQLLKGTLLENKSLLKKTMVFGLAIGIPSSVVYTYLTGLNSFESHSIEGFWSVIAYLMAVFPLGFAYLAIFVKLWNKHANWLKVFASPGRMALTNYLMQTLICITIFYGIGFGLATTHGPLSFVVITIVIYTFQVLVSNMWFKYFHFGPVEWVWRMLTYGRLFSLKK